MFDGTLASLIPAFNTANCCWAYQQAVALILLHWQSALLSAAELRLFLDSLIFSIAMHVLYRALCSASESNYLLLYIVLPFCTRYSPARLLKCVAVARILALVRLALL